jgi:hypothetical protein
MIRLVPCGVGECRQAVIDQEREGDKEPVITNKKRKGEHRTEYVPRPTLSPSSRNCRISMTPEHSEKLLLAQWQTPHPRFFISVLSCSSEYTQCAI